MSDKEIAKEILIKAIDSGAIRKDEFPNTKTDVEMICEAYKTIYAVVQNPKY